MYYKTTLNKTINLMYSKLQFVNMTVILDYLNN